MRDGGVVPLDPANRFAGRWQREWETLASQPIAHADPAAVGAIRVESDINDRGEAIASLPIIVAPGVRGMEPSISLDYNSHGPNGYLGVGFAISGESYIHRCERTPGRDGQYGPVNLTSSDLLCLDGTRLVLVSGTYGSDGARYKPENDPATLVVAEDNSDRVDEMFRAYRPDGRIDTYGGDGKAREGSPVTWRWGISRSEDRFGNWIEYGYRPTCPGCSIGSEPLHLSGIRYAGVGYAPGDVRNVVFEYEPRSDLSTGYFVGHKVHQGERLARIRSLGPGGQELHHYELAYNTDGLTGHSLLASVQRCSPAPNSLCMPPTRFEWRPASEWALGSGDEYGFGNFRDRETLLLLGAYDTVNGDFDLDPGGDLLVYSKIDPIDADSDGDVDFRARLVWHWLGGRNEASPYACGEPSPAQDANAGDVSLPWPAAVLPGRPDPEEEQLFTDILYPDFPGHRYQPSFGFSAIKFNDGPDLVLYPRRPANAEGRWIVGDSHEVRDEYDHAYADSLWWQSPVTGQFGQVDDGASGRIYAMFTADHNGDGFTDIWMCRGSHFKNGTWQLALHQQGGEPITYGYSIRDTQIACSAHDEVSIGRLDETPRESLLVIPAYEGEHGERPTPTDFEDPDDYIAEWLPIPAMQRAGYRSIEFDSGSSEGHWGPELLPRDAYGRHHDPYCRNGAAVAEGLGPVFSAGIGTDRWVDVNGDGLQDVLRYSVDGDWAAGVEGATWGRGIRCTPEIESVEGGRLTVYYNTGTGFILGEEPVYVFEGNAHANFVLSFMQAPIMDADYDGLPELFVPPSLSGGSMWMALRWRSDGSVIEGELPFSDRWPGHTDAATWREDILDAQRLRIVASPLEGGELMFLGVPREATPENYPTPIVSYADQLHNPEYIERVVDGLGATIEFGYGFTDARTADVSSIRQTHPPGEIFVADRHVVDGVGTTDYVFRDGVSDTAGLGFVGFGRVRERGEGVQTERIYDLRFDEQTGRYLRAGAPIQINVWQTQSHGDELRTLIHRETIDYDVDHQSEIGGVVTLVTPATRHVTESLGPAPAHDCDLFSKWGEVNLCNVCENDTDANPNDGVCENPGDGRLPAQCSVGAVALREIHTTERYDAFGSLEYREVATTRGGDATPFDRTVEERLDIEHDLDRWLLDQPKTMTIAHCVGNAEVACKTRTVETVFDEDTGTVKSRTIEPGSARSIIESVLVDDFGNVRERTWTGDDYGDPARDVRTTTVAWSSDGAFPIQEVNAAGHRIRRLYDSRTGLLVAEADPNGVTSFRRYDAFGRPTRTEVRPSPLGVSDTYTSYWYGAGHAEIPGTPVSLVVSESANGSGTVTYEYSAVGRLVRKVWYGMTEAWEEGDALIDPGKLRGDLIYQLYRYSTRGLPLEVSVPAYLEQEPAGWTSYRYDDADRLLDVTAPNGFGTHHRYFGFEHWTTTDDVAGPSQPRYQRYDAAGRVVVSQDSAGLMTCYDYEPFNYLSWIGRNCGNTNGGSELQEERYTHDQYGHLLVSETAESGNRTFGYDDFGQQVSQVDGNGVATAVEYDRIGRVVGWTAGEEFATFEYDGDRVGLLSSAIGSDDVATTYVHGDYNRLLSETTEVGGNQFVFGYTYGEGGRLATLTYPNPFQGVAPVTVRYDYDGAGYVRRIVETEGNEPLWYAQAANERSQITSAVFGEASVTSSREFDILTGLPSSVIAEVLGGETVQHLSYLWYQNGEASSRFDHVHQQGEIYEYDEAFRLRSTNVELPPVMVADRVELDRMGNITSRTGVGTYAYDAANRLSSIQSGSVVTSYGYDGNGNVTSYGPATLTYTTFDKIRSIAPQSGPSRTYRYDAFGNRVVMQAGSARSITLGLAELEGTRELRMKVPGPDGIVAELRRNSLTVLEGELEKRYVHSDWLGSGSVVTSESGEVLAEVSYGPWGNARQPDRWTHPLDPSELEDVGVGFTGHLPELEAGLIDMGGRFYDPRIARFVSPDPIFDPLNGQDLNRYSYAQNKPLTVVDPTGLEDCPKGSSTADICRVVRVPAGGGDIPGQPGGPPAGGGGGGTGDSDSGARSAPMTWNNSAQLNTGYTYYSRRRGGVPMVPNPGIGPWKRSYLMGNATLAARNSLIRLARGLQQVGRAETRRRDFTKSFACSSIVDCVGNGMANHIGGQSHVDESFIMSFFLEGYWGNMGSDYAMGVASGIAAAEILTAFAMEGAFAFGNAAWRASAKAAARGACFAAGTLVETAEGYKPIEEIQVGDLVWSRDDGTGEEGWKPVSAVFSRHHQPLLRVAFEADDRTGQVLYITAEHPLWSLEDDDWNAAAALDVGEYVYGHHGPLRLVEATETGEATTVYNFEVEDFHTYFVGKLGVWAHNSCERMLAHAMQPFKNGVLTNVGRALTKHPNIVGESGNVVQKLGGAANVNEVAADALRHIMVNGVRSTRATKNFGEVVEFKLSNGLGARFSAETNEFIGFLGRGL